MPGRTLEFQDPKIYNPRQKELGRLYKNISDHCACRTQHSKHHSCTVLGPPSYKHTKRVGKVVQIYPITVHLELNLVNTIPVLL